MQLNFNPAKIRLVIGIGNPDKEYNNTYHNAGRLFVDFLEEKLPDNKYQALNTNCFMNESGGFVKKTLRKKGVKPEALLVIHDDSDLNLGSFKFSFGRGSAGHKGAESVIRTLGTKDFWRLRIGIRPVGPIGLRRKKAEEFVLRKISAKDKKTLESVFAEIIPQVQNSR